MNVEMRHNECAYKISHALLFYVSEHQAVAVMHKVGANNQLSPGKGVNFQEVEELFRQHTGSQHLELLSPNTLAMSLTSIIWFEPGRKRPIYFNPPETDREKLKQFSGTEIYWPNLIFRLDHDGVFCWAVKCNRRPTKNTRLFIPPFTNIREHQVCMPTGFSIDRDAPVIRNAEAVSHAFFEGSFSHTSDDMKMVSYRGGHDSFWINYCKSKAAAFPHNRLKPTARKLEDIL